MEPISVVEARKNLAELMDRVAHSGERVIIARRDRPMMAWISIEDLHRLEALENESNSARDRRLAALVLADQARMRIRDERGGVLLPDSGEMLAALREEPPDGQPDMR